MATKTAAQTAPSLFNALRAARADLKAFIDRRLDAAEKRTTSTAKSVFRFARTLTKRLGGTAKRGK